MQAETALQMCVAFAKQLVRGWFDDSVVGTLVGSLLSQECVSADPTQPALPGGALPSPAERAHTLCKGSLLFQPSWQALSCSSGCAGSVTS